MSPEGLDLPNKREVEAFKMTWREDLFNMGDFVDESVWKL
jgi:hypothetical protein